MFYIEILGCILLDSNLGKEHYMFHGSHFVNKGALHLLYSEQTHQAEVLMTRTGTIKLCYSGDCFISITKLVPDSKVHEAYMGPTWGRHDPGGPRVGPMNLAIRGALLGDLA